MEINDTFHQRIDFKIQFELIIKYVDVKVQR